MIRRHDEQQLIWFFGEGQSHEAAGSPMGSLLARQEVLAESAGDCRRCGGTGFSGGRAAADPLAERREVDPDAPCQRCGGSGQVIIRHSPCASGTATTACRRCRGATGRDCGTCRGAGYVVSQLAAPTSTPLAASSYDAPEPCGGLRSRFAALSRRIYKLGVAHARILALYYGDCGARWEARAEAGGGRLLALYALTAAGQALLRQSRADLPASDALASLLQREEVHPLPRRTRALAAAAHEARELYRAAAERWARAA